MLILLCTLLGKFVCSFITPDTCMRWHILPFYFQLWILLDGFIQGTEIDFVQNWLAVRFPPSARFPSLYPFSYRFDDKMWIRIDAQFGHIASGSIRNGSGCCLNFAAIICWRSDDRCRCISSWKIDKLMVTMTCFQLKFNSQCVPFAEIHSETGHSCWFAIIFTCTVCVDVDIPIAIFHEVVFAVTCHFHNVLSKSSSLRFVNFGFLRWDRWCTGTFT